MIYREEKVPSDRKLGLLNIEQDLGMASFHPYSMLRMAWWHIQNGGRRRFNIYHFCVMILDCVRVKLCF